MIEVTDCDGKAIPCLPVSAIVIDGNGKVWTFLLGPDAKISGVTRLQDSPAPGPADPKEPVIEVHASITLNPPADEDSELSYITAVKYCTDKFGNRIVCPPRS